MKNVLIITTLLFSITINQSIANIIYVNQNATGANDGSSWTNAFLDLSIAITNSIEGDTIWVAKGIYKPNSFPYGCSNCTTGGSNSEVSTRDYSFRLKPAVAVYGGFGGGETNLSQRINYGSGELNETILSGDIGVLNDTSDNCYHVVVLREDSTSGNWFRLDGFTITSGNASGVGSITIGATILRNRGGGILNNSNGTGIYFYLENNILIANYATTLGGAVFAGGRTSIRSSKFIGNKAGTRGGGIGILNDGIFLINDNYFSDNYSASGGGVSLQFGDYQATMANNTFFNNEAINGGAIHVYSLLSNIKIINNVFFSNSAQHGGAAYFTGYGQGTVVLLNNTLVGNQASSSGGGLLLIPNAADDSHYKIINNIFWDNKKSNQMNIAGSDVQRNSNGGTIVFKHNLTQENSTYNTGIGILNNLNPMFLDPVNGDFRLQQGSPAINAGDSIEWSNSGTGFDMAGIVRPSNGGVDLGAYEYVNNVSISETASTNRIKLSFYPNPSYDIIYFKVAFHVSTDCELIIRNTLGDVIFKDRINSINPSETIAIPVHNWTAGLYIIELNETINSTLNTFIVIH